MLLMTLCLILSCFFAVTMTQEVSPVQTNVGSDANFSFMLTEDPNTDVVNIQYKFGGVVLTALGNRSVSNNPFYKDRVNFTGNSNQRLSFILRNVTLVDAGIYIAVLLVTDKTIGSQMLIVKAAPTIPQIVELEGHAVNGTNYHLNCSAQSNSQPHNHNLSMFSEWRKDDMLIHSSGRYIVNGTELTINGVSYKEDNGSTLTCVAFEDQLSKSSNSDKLIMDVKYGPDNIQLNPSDGIFIERENGKIVVNCTADCNPPCSFKWTKYLVPTPLSYNQTLIITSVSKSDTGRYLCNVSNNLNGISLTASINVTILYGARIVNLAVTDYMVNENSSAIFQCHVDSNPPSNITWMKESNNVVLQTESGVVKSQYRIESAECLNMGNYTCSAYNGIRTPAKASIPLFVRCHPRTDFRLALETKIYRKHHQAAVFRYTVIAYPLPTFTWTFLGNSSESIGLPDSASQQNNGLQSVLWFTSLYINDFGTYSVIADNSLPPLAREVFQIIPAVVPEIPSNIMIAEITQTSVIVEWVAGNNGGPQQIFHIIISAGSLTRTVNAADPGYRQRGTAVLDGLVPNTKYSINMIASNSVGSSNMTETIIVTTLEVPGTSNGTSVVGIAVGVSVGFLAVLILSIGIFIWRRHRPQQSDQGITLESDRNADTRPQDSDLYEKLDSDANRDIQMYSSLVMKNLSEDHQQCYENSQIQA